MFFNEIIRQANQEKLLRIASREIQKASLGQYYIFLNVLTIFDILIFWGIRGQKILSQRIDAEPEEILKGTRTAHRSSDRTQVLSILHGFFCMLF